MSRKRKKYSREFKEEALRLVDESDKPLTQIARELGIRRDLLQSWKGRRAAARTAEEAFPGSGVGTGEAEENRRLRRELEKVKQERDFLKKAAAYFAQESE
jgi:transposase